MIEKNDPLFCHTHIKWFKEITSLVLLGVLVTIVGFIFGWDSRAWKVVIATLLIVSACHSGSVLSRGRKLGEMPKSAYAYHSLWGVLGIAGAIWFYELFHWGWATVINCVIWWPSLILFAAAEQIERNKLFPKQATRRESYNNGHNNQGVEIVEVIRDETPK